MICRNQSGLTLIDLMVALVLFSVGVLGMIGMQAAMTQTSVVSEQRVIASTLADELVADIQIYGGNVPGTLATDAQNTWLAKVQNQLPAGTATVTTNPAVATSATAPVIGVLPTATATPTTVTITIGWTPPSRTAAGSQSNQYITQVTYP
ncbi:MAG: type IV pilus modification PilV family protein [Stenotrophobium sp.]